MFLHLSVSHSVHRRLVYTPAPPGRHPRGRHPPGKHTPPRRPLQRTVRILLECILVFTYLENTAQTSHQLIWIM